MLPLRNKSFLQNFGTEICYDEGKQEEIGR